MMISVLIVNHNGERFLERCLASLGRAAVEPAAASLEHLEILLADNGSRDGSVELVKSRFPGVEVLELGENLGFGAANNRAAERARGDAFLLLNNDAWLGEGCLDALVGRLTDEPRCGLAAPRLYYPDGRPQTVWAPDPGLAGEALRRLTNPFEGRAFVHGPLTRGLRRLTGGRGSGGGWFSAACVAIRREAFEEVGGFDPRFFLYFEDADLCLRLRQAGWRLAAEPSAVAYHEKGGSAAADGAVPEEESRAGARRAQIEYRRSQLLFYRLHRPAWERRWLRRHLRRKYKRVSDLEVRAGVLQALAEDAAAG